MRNLNCFHCRIASNINSYDMTLSHIEREIEVILVKNGIKLKNTNTNLTIKNDLRRLKASIHLPCGRCNNNHYLNFLNKQIRVFDKLEKLLIYNDSNAVDLMYLKMSCRGTYPRLYQYIERISNKKIK